MQREGDLRMLHDQFDSFSRAMLAASPLDTVAACGVGWWIDERRRVHLLWRAAAIAGDADYTSRGTGGAQVTAEFLAPIVKRARLLNEAVLLAHTHPFADVPGFSGIDDGGEDVLIPKIRQRAPAGPHGGLVLGRAGASVRAWRAGADGPVELRLLRGQRNPMALEGDVTYDRQNLALGPGTAAQLAAASATIVGVGGLGWDIATLLWSHGVGSVTLIDDDHVEGHNRPRLRGSTPAMIGRPKVEALAAELRRTRPNGIVLPSPVRFEAAEARRAAASADVIVVATDNLQSRLDVDRFARRLLVPTVDAGINIQVQDGHVQRVGGRVNVGWPTGPCLSCMGVLTPDAVAAEADPLGYRGQRGEREAAVAAFNATLAGLAVVEVLDVLLSFRGEPHRSRYAVYDGLRGVTRQISVPAAGSCGTCIDLPGAVFGRLP
jgi:molybdopterin/thiamine biosynthesis adenylyltransferase